MDLAKVNIFDQFLLFLLYKTTSDTGKPLFL
ncbi:MAG: hypothetical protein RL662_843 [Bacteroidota bacterium]|jgi:hypothetical protein